MPASHRPVGPRVALNAFRALGWASRHVPYWLSSRLARGIGVIVWALAGDRRSLVTRNMRRACPSGASEAEVRRCARRAFSNYALYWVDSFRLPSVSAAEVDRSMSTDGFEHLVGAAASGNGAILVLAHLGGWEYGGLWLANQGIHLTVVAERLEPPELFEWFTSLRSELGLTVVPLDGQAGSAIMRALKEGKAVALLADRDLQGTGVEVEFFGEATTLPAGPAMLALRTGAPLLPTAVYAWPDGRHHAVVLPPVPAERTSASLREDVARVTRLWAAELEKLIRRHPEQWHLFQPAWPADHVIASRRGRATGFQAPNVSWHE